MLHTTPGEFSKFIKFSLGKEIISAVPWSLYFHLEDDHFIWKTFSWILKKNYGKTPAVVKIGR